MSNFVDFTGMTPLMPVFSLARGISLPIRNLLQCSILRTKDWSLRSDLSVASAAQWWIGAYRS